MAGATNAHISGGVISNNIYYGMVLNSFCMVDGVRLFGNIGGSNNGQIIASVKVRIVNCIMEASTPAQNYQIYLSNAAANGTVIGGCKLVSGSSGYINAVAGVTPVTYNNEEVAA